MSDGTWVQYSAADARFNKSLDGGASFTELDLSGHTLFPETPPVAVGPTLQTYSSGGTVNNFAISSARSVILNCTNSASLVFTGFLGDNQQGDEIHVFSRGTGIVGFTHNSGSSSADNRLINYVTTCITYLAASKGYAKFVYIGSSWKLAVHEQGDWIASSVSAIIANGGGSVGSFSYSLNKFYLQGKKLTWMIYASFNLTGGTVSSVELQLPIASATHSGSHQWNFGYCSSAAANVVGCRTSSNLSTHLLFQIIVLSGGVANLAAGTTSFQGVFHVDLA
jgi:hypothetical protein